MTNREYYGEKILDLFESGIQSFGLNKHTNKIVGCRELDCRDCKFTNCLGACLKPKTDWLKEEYCPFTDIDWSIDWSKVEIDTKVLVSDNDKDWYRRYFAGFIDDKVFVFPDGTTSWSCEDNAISWKYAKLYDENEE